MSRWEPPARLEPAIYDLWVDENPKVVQGGELILEQNKAPRYSDDVKLAAHRVITNILGNSHANNLHIFGFAVRYEGFKIIVKDGHGYLLMAHQHHLKGTFKAEDGRILGDHPHFHQIDYDKINRRDGTPSTKRIVPPDLHPNISPAGMLNIFKYCYHFDDGSREIAKMPEITKIQTGIEDF
jgi:hypothetical protein